MPRANGSSQKSAARNRKSSSASTDTVDLSAIAEAVAADPHPPVELEAVVTAIEGDGEPAQIEAEPVEAAADGDATIESDQPPGEVPVADTAAADAPETDILDYSTDQTNEDSMTEQTTTDQMTDAATAAQADMQARFQTAFDKSAGMMGEMAELAKGHVEALTESSCIMASGLQDLGREAVANTQSAYATVTEDLRKFAAAKTPAELMQLQSELVRRNMDAVFSHGSRSTEAFLKLANDAFAPMSSRMSVVMDKVAKAA